jgi:flagellar M-ring protein FliF
MIKDFWDSLAPPARAGLAAGACVVVMATATAGWWLLRTDEQVLFADLKPQDAAVMVAELDRMKMPYRIASDGTTILVAAANVHATRLKLMSKDLPLHGTAGFELFNNADFGVTEFAQKINYQRALQGEITRTILSLSAVKDARVHLALPEEGLFKRSNAKAKAAVTLALRQGEELRAENVLGIQRLVAGAVPGMSSQDVTVLDERGVVLSRTSAGDGEPDAAVSRLDLKRDTERQIARKVTEVLERAFGAAQVLAMVDATLSMDQVRVTTEDVLGAPRSPGQTATGVVVRERENTRDSGAPLNARGEASGSNSQREVEYQVGRRVEQVATQPGAIRRLHVAAVVNRHLEPRQLEQLREIVSAAAGVVPERGDTVVVQSLQDLEPAKTTPPAGPSVDVHASGPTSISVAAASASSAEEAASPVWFWAVAIAMLLLVTVAALWAARRQSNAIGPARISAGERERLLAVARVWLQDGAPRPLATSPHAGERQP